jgi:hypothetical protein
MTGFVLVSFSGRVLVVQEVLRTVIIAPYRNCFKVGMGVRQGGILSTDLYKLYINPLLDLLPTSNAAHFHILPVFHQVKQWIGEVDNMEAKDWG